MRKLAACNSPSQLLTRAESRPPRRRTWICRQCDASVRPAHRGDTKDPRPGGRADWLAVDRFIGRLEDQLIEREIEPPAKFESGLPDRSRMREAEALVKRDAAAIRKVDATDHYVILLAPCRVNQTLHECESDAFSPVI